MLKISFGALIILGVVGVGFAGFRGAKMDHTPVEWFNDMAHQPKSQPQHVSTLFADGRGARQPVAGTVPIGYILPGRYDQSGANNQGGTFTSFPDYANTGRIGDVFGEGFPMEVTADVMARGQQRYNISCAICHGRTGAGNGVVKSFGLVTVASLLDDRIVQQPEGQIFNTITHGKGTMGAYGPVVAVEDRWSIIVYLRALQRTQNGKLADLPEAMQQQLSK